jgi:hypothetical protein
MARFQSPADRAAALAFFAGHEAGHALFHRVLSEIAKAGPFELAATKSRVSLVARTRFLWCHEANDDGSIWLGFLLPRHVESPRLRAGPAGGRWSHHVKVSGPVDLDAELIGWLREAYEWDRQPVKTASPRSPEGRAP